LPGGGGSVGGGPSGSRACFLTALPATGRRVLSGGAAVDGGGPLTPGPVNDAPDLAEVASVQRLGRAVRAELRRLVLPVRRPLLQAKHREPSRLQDREGKGPGLRTRRMRVRKRSISSGVHGWEAGSLGSRFLQRRRGLGLRTPPCRGCRATEAGGVALNCGRGRCCGRCCSGAPEKAGSPPLGPACGRSIFVKFGQNPNISTCKFPFYSRNFPLNQ